MLNVYLLQMLACHKKYGNVLRLCWTMATTATKMSHIMITQTEKQWTGRMRVLSALCGSDQIFVKKKRHRLGEWEAICQFDEDDLVQKMGAFSRTCVGAEQAYVSLLSDFNKLIKPCFWSSVIVLFVKSVQVNGTSVQFSWSLYFSNLAT